MASKSRPRSKKRTSKSSLALPTKEKTLKTRIVNIPPRSMVDRYLKPTAPYIVLLLSPGPVTVVRKVYAKGKDKPQTTRMTFRNDRAIYIPAAEPGTEATIESLSDGIITFGKIWPPDCN